MTGMIGRFVLVAAAAGSLRAQELEPRALQNGPVGTSFLVLATGYSRGNLLFEPAQPIEDARADVWSVVAGALRIINVGGLSSKVSFAVPFVTGTWAGVLSGIDTSTSRSGIADPRVQVAINFVGSPALTRSEMRTYRQSTVVGMQLMVSLPLGQYYPERLINLGTNRWSFQSRLGLSQSVGSRWVFEGYAGATVFTTNHDFYGGQTLEQDPFYEVQAHAIYGIRGPGLWAAVSAGHAWHGRSTVNGVANAPLNNMRMSAMLRLPLAPGHALKLVYINGLTTSRGADFDTFQVAYQYAFGGKP
jgi:hypothetical protein